VQVNDSGPYGKGRIIDLNKKAFQKIADIGTGVINVKVEEILN
jgi:rare lipoprotein A (peptidoglycan hydrolase)